MRLAVILLLGMGGGCHALLPLGHLADAAGVTDETSGVDLGSDVPLDGPSPVDFIHSEAGPVDAGPVDHADGAQGDAVPDGAQPDTGPDASVSPPLVLAAAGNSFYVFDTNGTSQQAAIPIPYGTASRPNSEDARDLVGLAGGKVAFYNGTFSPYLSVYDPGSTTKLWNHNTYQGWSTVANVSYGGLAAWGTYLYATDMAAGTTDTTAGIVRFVTGTWATGRHGNEGFIDVNVGLDNKVYALHFDKKKVVMFDPKTMAPLKTFTLPVQARALTVNAKGEIFAAAWSGYLYHIAGNYTVVNQLDTKENDLMDIDLGYGALVASNRFGKVVVTTEALSASSSFSVGVSKPTFIALVPAP
jgi:hypothetical protein